MGIQGLLPFLKKIHTPVNISQFKGCTVAIDAYCWLHKGAFSCAEKLALGEKTEQYVYYCMKYVDCLLHHGVKPIMVFDGCHLPSKKEVESSRRERRNLNRKKAAQLLREGKRVEAKECLQRCVDITPQMALELMNVCRARGVDCIVAPYEADAQLAFLNKAGIAQIIITEDSDLLLFGCEKVIFKMDFYGNGVLIEQSRLNEVVDIQDSFYTFEKFRYMCILSGCDYQASLPGIGLVKASRVFKVARQADIRQLLRKIPSYLKMNIVVTEDYVEGFVRADNTFLYQLAFDPLTRKLCPLTPYPPEVEVEELRYAGPYFSNQLALQIALGNVDIHTHETISDFNPQTFVPKHAKKQAGEGRHMHSIWSPAYRPRARGDLAEVAAAEGDHGDRPCLAGREVRVKNTLTKKSPVKHVRKVPDSVDVKSDLELADLYSAPSVQRKRRRDSKDEPAPRSKTPTPSKASDSGDKSPSTQQYQKPVLSPSKASNQIARRPAMTPDDAFSLMDRESAVVVSSHGKENNSKNSPANNRNKFAVSALAKKARFSLDAPSLPNIKVEVKSRYFSSTPAPTRSPEVQESSMNGETSKRTISSTKSAVLKNEQDGKNSPQTAQQDEGDKSASLNTLDCVELSPILPAKGVSTLSKFSYNSDSSDRKAQSAQCQATQQTPASQTTVSKPSGKQSPGSAFSWSSFKFSKFNSTPTLSSFIHTSAANSNRPFKRVQSEKVVADDNNPSTPSSFDSLCSPGDGSRSSQNAAAGDWGECSNLSRSSSVSVSAQGCDGDSLSDLALSQRSTAGLDSSQRSNLYSIDSDCFPTSQDFVDLTDCDSFSGKSVGGASDCSSSTNASKASLQTPRATPKITSGNSSKCRVSGLSRGKKKASPAADQNQQKIRDMFSRFAHTK